MESKHFFHLALAVIAACMVEASQQTNSPSRGDCIENAVSNGTHCNCIDGYSGNGDFFCYNASEECCCRILNDPGIKALNDEVVIFHPAASTKLLDVRSLRTAAGGGWVDVVISAWTIRVKGKMYYKGIELILGQTLRNGTSQTDVFQLIACGEVSNFHTWQIKTKENDETFNIFATVTSADQIEDSKMILNKFGCHLVLNRKPADFYEIEVECAQIRFGIRAFVPNKDYRVPGIYIALDKFCTRHFHYGGVEKYGLCLEPNKSFEVIQEKTGISDVQEAVTWYSLFNGGTTNYPQVPNKLVHLQNKLCKCSKTELSALANETSWALQEPQFIHCVSTKGQFQHRLVTFLFQLATYYCESNVRGCQQARRYIHFYCKDYKKENRAVKAWFNRGCNYCYYNYYCYGYYYYSKDYYYCYHYYYKGKTNYFYYGGKK